MLAEGAGHDKGDEMPTSTNMSQEDLLEVVPPFIAPGSSVMVRILELPPGDPGLGPHRHSGPVFGYMLEGEMLFELEGAAPYPIKAGGCSPPLILRNSARAPDEPIRRGHDVCSWS